MQLTSNPVLRIKEIEHLQWESGYFEVAPRSFSSLAFRISGDAVIWGGRKEYEVHSEEILYLPQNTAYTARYGKSELIVFHFVTQKDDPQICVYSYPNAEQFRQLFLQALQIWEKKAPGYETFALAQLYTVLGTIAECEAKSTLPSHFLRALAIINAQYTDSALRVDNVCQKAGIGTTVFRQLFKKHYQKTPTEYVTRLRLEYARKLISQGVTVESAAYESGFSDPKYFARVVKKQFGCTPKSFKNYGK